MKLARLIAALGDYAKETPDLEVELARTIALDAEKEEMYEVRLDFPIIGLAEKDGDLLFVTDADPALLKFGKVTRLP